ncbi:MAG: DEAD/DEAH box helicase [Steroidobacteraceae bacterium]
MIELRPYQHDVLVKSAEAMAAGKRRLIVVAPTGAGKTIIGTSLINNAVATGQNVLVIAHTREIIKQTSAKLYDNSIEHGVIQAGFTTRPDEAVQVASVQTLWARAIRGNRMELPPADFLIIDECHHCPARTYRKIINAYPLAVLIGLTATPCRGDGRGLGGIFDAIVECPQVAELIAQKFLVKTRVYAPVDPDLSGIATRTGDYVEEQLAERMDRPSLIGDIISHWHKHGERRKTVCFAVNVAHSIHLRDEFAKSGVRAEHLDGSVPKADRDAVLARLASGATEVITNCMVLTEGWDMPEVSCAILARPTRKMGLYRQMVGRVLRAAPGKVNAIVLDHSGAVFRHGFIEDRVDWTLDPDKRQESPTHAARLRAGYSSRLLECTQCGSTRVAGDSCGHCGFRPERKPQAVVFKDGDLALVDRQRRSATIQSDPSERIRWHGMLTYIATKRGYRSGWIAHKFREKFGTWPPVSNIAPIEPSPEVLAWVRSRDIAYAKAMDKAV